MVVMRRPETQHDDIRTQFDTLSAESSRVTCFYTIHSEAGDKSCGGYCGLSLTGGHDSALVADGSVCTVARIKHQPDRSMILKKE
jgi:hypothetical protein